MTINRVNLLILTAVVCFLIGAAQSAGWWVEDDYFAWMLGGFASLAGSKL